MAPATSFSQTTIERDAGPREWLNAAPRNTWARPRPRDLRGRTGSAVFDPAGRCAHRLRRPGSAGLADNSANDRRFGSHVRQVFGVEAGVARRSVRADQAVRECVEDEFRAGVQLELLHDVGAVRL